MLGSNVVEDLSEEDLVVKEVGRDVVGVQIGRIVLLAVLLEGVEEERCMDGVVAWHGMPNAMILDV